MNTIALIGCGNLGRRHLQSITRIRKRLNIYVYDINTEMFPIAEKLIRESGVFYETTVNYIADFNALPSNIDVAVIASSAKGRRELVENLLAISRVKYMILEKVLFQSYSDYDYIQNLLDKANVKTFVNCPRRLYPVYKNLRETLHGKEFSFYLHGGNWGLACNFIHFFDLLSFIGGSTPLKLDISKLDSEIIDSRRIGYKEITGTIIGNIGNCKSFFISSQKECDSDVVMFFETEDEKIIVLESKGLLYRIKGSSLSCENFRLYYQSELTEKYIESLLSAGTCELTTYNESAVLHKAFIEQLTDFFETKEGGRSCPIT